MRLRALAPLFTALSRLSTSDVADVLQTVRLRIVRDLVRLGVVEAGPEVSCSDAGPAPRDPVLLLKLQNTIEIEREDKPALIAETLACC